MLSTVAKPPPAKKHTSATSTSGQRLGLRRLVMESSTESSLETSREASPASELPTTQEALPGASMVPTLSRTSSSIVHPQIAGQLTSDDREF